MPKKSSKKHPYGLKGRTKLQAPKWDLGEIYKSAADPKISADLDAVSAAAIQFEKRHKGKIGKMSLQKILAALKDFEVVYRKMYFLASYPDFLFTVNTKDEKVNSLVQRLELAMVEIQNHLLFFSLELAHHQKLPIFIEDKQASEYKFMFQKLAADRAHQLRPEVERILNTKSSTSHNGWLKLFFKTDSAAKIHFHGEDLNREQALKLLYSPSRKRRQGIYTALTESLSRDNAMFTYIYNMLLLDKSQTDKIRKYESPEKSRHESNGVSQQAVDALIAAAKKNFKLVAKYYAIKRKLLGIKDMQVYDRYAPLPSGNAKHYTFPQAASMVHRAFSSFDRQFGEMFVSLLDAKHIDAQTAPNKRGGAYCASMPKGYLPYIMMNFVGTRRDVQTLAHESGHAIHDILAEKHPLLVAHPPLTIAETASIFGEMIVFEDLLGKAGSDRERIAMYAEKIEDIFATIFRQIVFLIMEREAHAAMAQKTDLTASELNNIWLRTQAQMFGKSISFPKGYQYWWGYVSHFYEYPFYVYAYAFGNLLVFALWQEYKTAKKSGDKAAMEKFVVKYKRILAVGGTRSTMETMRRFGYDPEDPNFWENGFKALRDLIAAMAKLC